MKKDKARRYLLILWSMVCMLVVVQCAIFFIVCHEQSIGQFYTLADFGLSVDTANGTSVMCYAVAFMSAIAAVWCAYKSGYWGKRYEKKKRAKSKS